MEVSGDVLQAALAKAITESITPDVRDAVIAKALQQHLFYEDKRNGNASVITETFKRALNDATSELAKEVVSRPENNERLRVSIQEAFEATISDKAFIAKISEKMMSWLRF